MLYIGIFTDSVLFFFTVYVYTAPIVYIERAAYTALEEDMQVELTVVRYGNSSEVTVVLFTTRSGTALGIVVCLTVN